MQLKCWFTLLTHIFPAARGNRTGDLSVTNMLLWPPAQPAKCSTDCSFCPSHLPPFALQHTPVIRANTESLNHQQALILYFYTWSPFQGNTGGDSTSGAEFQELFPKCGSKRCFPSCAGCDPFPPHLTNLKLSSGHLIPTTGILLNDTKRYS